jgi:hypothetical protein
MAQPEFVPTSLDAQPRRGLPMPPAEGWSATRTSDIGLTQPHGAHFGAQGPDQGYVLTLLPLFANRLRLADGEERHDVEAGCVGVALKRASLFGRAPVVYDLDVAFTIWGYLDDPPAPALVELRRPLFEAAAHDYGNQRAIVDLVDDDILRLPPDQVRARHAADWRSLLRLHD